MDAYSLVGPSVRKKLDEMLQTWKTSVPGSLDKRPVFPPEITKRIESALIQAKTVALQQQQQQHRGQQEMLRRRGPAIATPTPYRATPTPPQGMARYPPPAPQNYIQHPHVPNGQNFAQVSAAIGDPYFITRLIHVIRLTLFIHSTCKLHPHKLPSLHISSFHSFPAR